MRPRTRIQFTWEGTLATAAAAFGGRLRDPFSLKHSGVCRLAAPSSLGGEEGEWNPFVSSRAIFAPQTENRDERSRKERRNGTRQHSALQKGHVRD